MRTAGCLGVACCTAAPTADGHVSVPFFFFSSLSFRPFPQNSTFLPPSRSLSYCGGGGKRRGGGVGKGGRGGGAALEPRPRGGPRPHGHCSPPPRTPPRHPQGAGVPVPTAREPRLRVRAAGPEQKQSQGERAQGTTLHPFLRRSDSPVVWLYCLGLKQVAADLFRFFKGEERDSESLKVTEDSAERDAGLWMRSFLPRMGVGIPTYDRGPPRQSRDPPTGASLSPSWLQRPLRVLDRTRCRYLGRDLGMGTRNLEIARLNNQSSQAS